MVRKACVFIDGENLRHNIVDLFEKFDQRDYIPKGSWADFFDWLVAEASGHTARRLRTYWYVIRYIDYYPYHFPDADTETSRLSRLLSQDQAYRAELSSLTGELLVSKLGEIKRQLTEKKLAMQRRFDGWTAIQNAIARDHKSIEFRRAGGIRYDLFKGEFGTEKAVDVKLAVDLLEFREIYDIAMIVSGDQDYVPAVKVAKDSGKEIVNVAFRTRGGRLLPGGARRLNQATDWSYEISYSDLKQFLKL